MKILSIKIDDELVDQLDFLVKKGKFRSRSEAMRHMLKDGISREVSILTSENNDFESLHNFLNLLKKDKVKIDISSSKTAVELVAEGRER